MEELLRAEPLVLRDGGLKRTREVGQRDIEERLVEVLVSEEGLWHRCPTRGQWDDSYPESTRHARVGEHRDGQPIYWGGGSLRVSHL